MFTEKKDLDLEIALEKLDQKRHELAKKCTMGYGAACAPREADYVEQDPAQGPYNLTWAEEIREEDDAVNAILHDRLMRLSKPATDGLPPISSDKVWVWGGPTLKWGGSMADDTLIRGADYFQAENVVYVYGPTNEKMLSLHGKYKKMLCQVNENCRTEGALCGSEEENAECLSKLSLKFPNIVGAMCDDYGTGSTHILLPERYEKIYRGVKKYNSNLKVYGVIYEHELQKKDFQLIQPYIDVVNFWLWFKKSILEIDKHLEECRKNFPGKPIVLGIFIHDYGCSDTGNLPEMLIYELEKAREFLAKGWIEGIILLGDREIKKWPEAAGAVRDYLLNRQ